MKNFTFENAVDLAQKNVAKVSGSYGAMTASLVFALLAIAAAVRDAGQEIATRPQQTPAPQAPAKPGGK